MTQYDKLRAAIDEALGDPDTFDNHADIVEAALSFTRDMIPRDISEGELRECPFCGEETVVINEIMQGAWIYYGCKDDTCAGYRCVYGADDMDAVDGSIKKWNTRATDKALEKLLEVVE